MIFFEGHSKWKKLKFGLPENLDQLEPVSLVLCVMNLCYYFLCVMNLCYYFLCVMNMCYYFLCVMNLCSYLFYVMNYARFSQVMMKMKHLRMQNMNLR
jgi:hypothetical protein